MSGTVGSYCVKTQRSQRSRDGFYLSCLHVIMNGKVGGVCGWWGWCVQGSNGYFAKFGLTQGCSEVGGPQGSYELIGAF